MYTKVYILTVHTHSLSRTLSHTHTCTISQLDELCLPLNKLGLGVVSKLLRVSVHLFQHTKEYGLFRV